MPLAIVTDSTSDLTREEAAELGVTVVPLNVMFESESLRDGVDIGPEEFFRRLAHTKVLPKTSQPSVGAFLEAYEQVLSGGATAILSIHISSKLSGTLNSARTARDSMAAPSAVSLLDSEAVTAQLAFGVRAAAQVAKAGGTLEQARAAAESALRRSTLYGALDTLEFLQRGGRIGRARAWIGSVLNVKPFITVRNGEVAPLERVRTRGKAMERLIELTTAHHRVEEVTLLHSGSVDDLERVRGRLAQAMPDIPIRSGWLGPVVGVYGGPNVLGTVVLDREAGT